MSCSSSIHVLNLTVELFGEHMNLQLLLEYLINPSHANMPEHLISISQGVWFGYHVSKTLPQSVSEVALCKKAKNSIIGLASNSLQIFKNSYF